jgi:diguanylate cyclase (GGDEF)-like protein/PAS domain S-box-containing protein
VEFPLRRPDGELRHTRLSAETVLGPDGAPLRVVGANIDITRYRRNEAALQAARLQLRLLVDTLPAWTALLDRDKRCVVANQRYAELFGMSIDELSGRDFVALVPAPYRERHARLMDRCLAGEVVEATEDYLDANGVVTHVQGRYMPVQQDGAVTGLVISFSDISELKRVQLRLGAINADLLGKMQEVHALQQQMHEMAVRDTLTGLHNRRYLDDRLPRELARASRSRMPLCIALGDIDHFKRLNDRHGHLAGDAVLRALGAQLTRLLRESDLVCRWGGEELLIAMPEADAAQAQRRIESLREAVAAAVVTHGGEALAITLSFGIAEYPRDGTSADELIQAADTALYQAKADGRDCVRLYGRFDRIHPSE